MTAKCPSDLNSNLSSILAVSSLQGWENVTTNSTFRTDWQGFPRPLDLKVGDPGAGDEKDVLDFNNFSLSFFLLLVQWAICRLDNHCLIIWDCCAESNYVGSKNMQSNLRSNCDLILFRIKKFHLCYNIAIVPCKIRS